MLPCPHRPVSTHSRPKAAGQTTLPKLNQRTFQHTAARRRLALMSGSLLICWIVSTHSRPKAAGLNWLLADVLSGVSTHSRPKAAGQCPKNTHMATIVSTHSRPKAAGACRVPDAPPSPCFNTQPPEGGWTPTCSGCLFCFVSTHSRPKAAGSCKWILEKKSKSFNTQPPEGGWIVNKDNAYPNKKFQHTAARRRLAIAHVHT